MSERPIDDVPEADAIEQSQPVRDEPARPADDLDHVEPDVPEADALEQQTAVDVDDEEPR